MGCVTPTHLSDGREIEICQGQASLEEMEGWVNRWQSTGGLQINWTHIVLPSCVSEASLRARRDRVLELRDDKGTSIVRSPRWIMETGKVYTWSDD